MAHHVAVCGSSWCSDCKRAKRFLGDQQVEYKWVDVEQDAEGRAFVEKVNDGKDIIPTIVFDDGAIIVEPSNAQLAQKLGLPTMARHMFYDLIVVGGGPAGLTAAFYASREGISTLVIDAPAFVTSMPGVFAAGDARDGATKQVASAVGEGAGAALAVRRYLEELAEARHVETEMMEPAAAVA